MLSRGTGIARSFMQRGAARGRRQHPDAHRRRPAMPYQLPPLPYAFNALEPHIDARTMEIHHDKHHAAYVNNLNKAIEGTDWDNNPIEDLLRNIEKVPENIRTVVRNNGGGHANHSLFWVTMGPNKGGQPSGKLAEAINAELGGFENFKKDFTAAAIGRFGSGWAWLSLKNKKLAVESTPNQDTPLMQGNVPLLGVDVWEHAYYLLYQNRRPDYVAAFFNVIDWGAVAKSYEAAMR
jgi:Fe-Mn family superoxide dismutase